MEYNKIMKTLKIYSHINKQLKSLDIQCKKIGMNTVAMIIDRDFHGTTSYVRKLRYIYGKNYNLVGYSISGILVGYCIAGIVSKNSKKIGDIGMIHISEPMRNLGLGSLLCFIQYRYLMESKPDFLYCEIADKTGKILNIIQELNFTNSNNISEKDGHPIWMREFISEEDRNTFIKQLEDAIKTRLIKISNIGDQIHAQAALLDVDNPDKLNFKLEAKKRINNENMNSSLRIVPFYGFKGSKIRLARLPKDENTGYRIILEVIHIDLIHSNKFLQDNNINRQFIISIQRSLRKKKTGKIKITTYPTWDISLLRQYALKFANIGEELLKITI